jgi:hypothetical protein
MSPTEIHKNFIDTLGKDSYSTVTKWVAEYKRGSESFDMMSGLGG